MPQCLILVFLCGTEIRIDFFWPRVGVGDSYNQHRDAYTVDEQKQLLGKKKKKKRGKYIILCLETGM